MDSPLDQILRIPHEQMRKSFRASQRLMEKETLAINIGLAEAQRAAAKDNPDEVLRQLDGMIGRVGNLKRKIQAFDEEEVAFAEKSKTRLAHLNEISKVSSPADSAFEKHGRTRLDRLLVDYLLRAGHCDVAARLAREKNIEDLVDVDAFAVCNKITSSLLNQSTTECLLWCNENKQSLRKAKSSLEFDLRLQEYIELVRNGKHHEAIAYSKKHFMNHVDTHLDEIQRAAALLAFPPSTTCSPYQQLYNMERWNYLTETFLITHHSLYNIPGPPLLHIALSAGLAALKTPSCYSSVTSSSSNTASSTTSLCPICSTELNELAQHVPYAHHVRSIVEPDPVVLPNGRIYGRDKLRDFAEKAGVEEGKVRDPVSGAEWDWYVLRKVYVM